MSQAELQRLAVVATVEAMGEMSHTKQRLAAVAAAMVVLESAGIDARLSEFWRGGERVYSIVMMDVYELGLETADGTTDEA